MSIVAVNLADGRELPRHEELTPAEVDAAIARAHEVGKSVVEGATE